jgi:hypothetical protein
MPHHNQRVSCCFVDFGVEDVVRVQVSGMHRKDALVDRKYRRAFNTSGCIIEGGFVDLGGVYLDDALA